MKKTLSLAVSTLLASTLIACGGSKPPPAKPDTTAATEPATTEPAAPAAPAEPAPPAEPPEPPKPDPAKVKADLLAAETTAFEKAKPIFDKNCSGCHKKGSKNANAKKLAAFNITTYPYPGDELTKHVREALGIGGGKATMPKTKPGSIKGDDLAAIAAWADAFDASKAGGAHDKPAEAANPTDAAKPGKG